MRDAADERAGDTPGESADREPGAGATGGTDGADGTDDADDGEDLAALRERVEEEYDFDDFGPRDMAEMSVEEWDAAFDPDSWITGEALLDRVERDLDRRVADREVFAVVERVDHEGAERVLAYSDEGYAMVSPDGGVEGFGTVLRDVKPTVALCSMDSYEPGDPPEGAVLPHPEEVPTGTGDLGNRMLQAVAGIQVLAGLVLLGSIPFLNYDRVGVTIVAGVGFLFIAVVLFATVANARLSDRYRAREYRERLRAVGLESGERPDFLPTEDGDE